MRLRLLGEFRPFHRIVRCFITVTFVGIRVSTAVANVHSQCASFSSDISFANGETARFFLVRYFG